MKIRCVVTIYKIKVKIKQELGTLARKRVVLFLAKSKALLLADNPFAILMVHEYDNGL